jgi:hypothetical protein
LLVKALSLTSLDQVCVTITIRIILDFNVFLAEFCFVEFYVGDGGYSAFSAKDCSINLAKMSFEEADYNMYGKVELTLSEKDILE